MKLLFFMTHAGHARNYEWTLRRLAERGHTVVVALDRLEKKTMPELNDLLEQIVADCPTISMEAVPDRTGNSFEAGQGLRMALDYLRYLEPVYAESPKLHERAEERVPPAMRRLAELPWWRSDEGRARLRTLLTRAERAVRLSPEVVAYVQSHAPDAVLVTPLVELGSPQTDYLRCARRLGISSALLVASWDNLTVKGGIHEAPDAVAVWNKAQKQEAVQLHGVAPERVVVTGAVAYDHWFDLTPSRSREQFCRDVGLDPSRPYVLYAGSSRFIAPGEGKFVRDWVVKLRRRAPKMSRVQVLARPHPTNPFKQMWVDELAEVEGVVLHPPQGVNPTTAEARADYYDSVYHCACVVGVNTSAMIESAIVGKPVLTVLDDRYATTQHGTLHFKYLLPENGGFVIADTSFHDHARSLAASLRDPQRAAARTRPFVEAFVRPCGIDVPASHALVAEVEKLVDLAVEPESPRGTAADRVLATVAARTIKRHLRRRERERERRLRRAAAATEAQRRAGGPVPATPDAPELRRSA